MGLLYLNLLTRDMPKKTTNNKAAQKELQAAVRYPTVQDRIRALEELQSKTIVWAHQLCDAGDSQQYRTVTQSMQNVSKTLVQEKQFAELVDSNRNKGTVKIEVDLGIG